jgi:hypothetical protein
MSEKELKDASLLILANKQVYPYTSQNDFNNFVGICYNIKMAKFKYIVWVCAKVTKNGVIEVRK